MHRRRSGDAASGLTAILHAFADFADLKSPWFRGHSTAVASPAAEAAHLSGCTPAVVADVGRAGLIHDLGRVGVINGIWDKAGALTLDEWERVRLHPYLTERILSRSNTWPHSPGSRHATMNAWTAPVTTAAPEPASSPSPNSCSEPLTPTKR